MKNIFFSFVAAVFLFASCDYVAVPQQAGGTPIVPTSDTIRRIFVEDFTGHFCPNCPRAAREIDSLKLAFPEQIISMSIHTSAFGTPSPPAGLPAGALPNTFAEDFRVPAEELNYVALFDVNSFPYPALFLNRAGFPSSMFMDAAGLPSAASTALLQPMTAYLKITPYYNTTSRVLTVSVAGEFMVDTTGAYNIALYLTEDSLTGSQEDNTLPLPEIDNNYVFNDVFRGCINPPGSIGGESVITGTISANTGINYSTASLATFTLNASYIPAHCHIIAILYKVADWGVLQAAESKLIP